MSSNNSAVVVDAKNGNHTATLIFLHGRGDTGHGWADTFARLKPPYVKCICPTAPEIAITLAGGCVMNAWFDLLTPYGEEGLEDESGIKRMTEYIHNLIENEQTKFNIPAKRIMLGGYSQGGGLAFHSALRYKEPLAGLVALSCWLPLRSDYPQALNENLRNMPVLQCHGEIDPIIPCEWSMMSVEPVKHVMSDYEYKRFPGLGHTTFPP
ncbi:acyl-protein thioesterase 1-like protein, partial [Dinothrombium tinctorium]